MEICTRAHSIALSRSPVLTRARSFFFSLSYTHTGSESDRSGVRELHISTRARTYFLDKFLCARVLIFPLSHTHTQEVRVIGVVCGSYHTLFLSGDGRLHACGDNSRCVCGWVCGSVGGWVGGWVGVWVGNCVCACAFVCVCVCVRMLSHVVLEW